MARRNNNKRKRKAAVEVEPDLDRFAGSSEDEAENEKHKEEQESDSDEERESTKQVVVASNENDDGDDDESINEEDEYTNTKQKSGGGMSGAMARILGAPIKQSSGTVVLSKTTTPLQRRLAQEKEALKQQKEKRKANRERNLTALQMPLSVATTNSIENSSTSLTLELQEERLHRRVATRGVVALFNAIAQHQQQKNVGEGASTTPKATAPKLTKHGFLDMIKSKAAESSRKDDEKHGRAETTTSATKSSKPKWNALQDDFMLNSKLKDWDKESSEEEQSDGEANEQQEDDLSDNGEQEEVATKKRRVSAH